MRATGKGTRFWSIKTILRAIIIVVILGLSVNIIISFFMDFQSLKAALFKVRWEHIVVPFALFLLIYLIDSLRLTIVLSQFGYKIKLIDAFINSFMGYFFAYLTPMATGGQPFQIYHLKKLNYDATTSTNIIMSRFIIYLGSAIILTLVFIPSILPILEAVGAQSVFLYTGLAVSVFSTCVIVILFIRPDWVGGLLSRIEKSFLGRFITRISKKSNWGNAAKAWSQGLRKNIAFLWREKFYIILIDTILCITILAIQVFSLTWILITLLEIELNFFHIFITVLLLNLVVYYIPSPGASGGLEGVYTMVFSLYTGLPQLSFIAITIWRFATYYLQIFFGLLVFGIMRRRGILRDQTDPGHPPKPVKKRKSAAIQRSETSA